MAVERIVTVAGRAMPIRGADIDTDRIVPARFLKSVSFDGLEAHLFEDDRREAATRGNTHPVDDPRFEGARVLLVNANFGCGSSREHAPQAIYRRGIRAVIGESFSEIFFGNSIALGMPCPTASPATIAALMAAVDADPQLPIELDLQAMTVSAGGQRYDVALPAPAREAFVSGSWDATGLLLDRFDEVRQTAARLPYVSGTW